MSKLAPAHVAFLSGSFIRVGDPIPGSQISADASLTVGAVNVTSFLTKFASINNIVQAGIWIDSQASGTNGGTFTSGAWRTRVLNTAAVNAIAGASLASNEVTLPAGTFLAFFAAPARNVNAHAAQLYNVTSAAVLARGCNASSSSTTVDDSANTSWGVAGFTLAAPAALTVRHRCQTTANNTGFGSACSFGDTETYSQLMILRTA